MPEPEEEAGGLEALFESRPWGDFSERLKRRREDLKEWLANALQAPETEIRAVQIECAILRRLIEDPRGYATPPRVRKPREKQAEG